MTRLEMRMMEYEEMKLLKQSEKNRVRLVREKGKEQVFVQKTLQGRHAIYSILQDCPHPYLPKLYEVSLSDEATTIVEEYIEGQLLGSAELSEKQLRNAIGELCTVLEFVHEKGIVHRDVKPSNIIFAKDGHIRLIDFDAARMHKDDLEQDTRLLGTRGYAPPEQYGFAQTDARADIYSLGVTIEQLLGEKAYQPRYRKMIGRCTNLNPDKRYQSVGQVKRALFPGKRIALYAAMLLVLIALLWSAWSVIPNRSAQPPQAPPQSSSLRVLPAPENLYWDGETGIAVWDNVPGSGENGELVYRWKLYYSKDTNNPPNVDESPRVREGTLRMGWESKQTLSKFSENLGFGMQENGYYYFAVSAVGDGVQYTDSPYVLAPDPFHYTGENAPPLPTPTEIAWKVVVDDGPQYFATWSNLDDYLITDTFNVTFYNQDGVMVGKNIWTKEDILAIGNGGVWFNTKKYAQAGQQYRFTVSVRTSRPNEYQSTTIPDPVPEEYYSDWITIQ